MCVMNLMFTMALIGLRHRFIDTKLGHAHVFVFLNIISAIVQLFTFAIRE